VIAKHHKTDPRPRQLLPALPYLLHPCNRVVLLEGDGVQAMAGYTTSTFLLTQWLDHHFLDTTDPIDNPDRPPVPPRIANSALSSPSRSTRSARVSLLLAILSIGSAFGADPQGRPSNTGVTAETLAVIINDADPRSQQIARYYQVRRRIPDANMIHVSFVPGKSVMSLADFQKIRTKVAARTPASIQVYALTWAAPYRVECMSITTAFAVGFDSAFCSQKCSATKLTSYFNSDSRAPYSDHGIRPTMALSGVSVDEVKALIDRGLAADASFPRGTGYLVSTEDKVRNVRAMLYPTILQYLGEKLDLQIVHADTIKNRRNVLFYFTGTAQVNDLETIRFLPGAIADHLTSAGGQLTDSQQMSSLRWLEAGATGSYGAVVEPCNLPDKFPSPGIVIKHYLLGESLIEAYWKGVAMPGEGIFIGEPLAMPFGRHSASREHTDRPATVAQPAITR
jgi:uncharacterized protein (TIGR03790 family)